ncbi:MAG TPA: TIGR01777 family oxidoreductase [Bryobacteraceae bacterium]
MKIAISGATGFLGSLLTNRLLEDGHSVRALVRRRDDRIRAGVQIFEWSSAQGEPPPDSLDEIDAVIHLAGEPVARRWTPELKRLIRSSRVDSTRHLVNALSTQTRRPRVLICASAIGIYGSRGDEVLTETSAPGNDFLAGVVVDWEKSAELAEALVIRVVRLRLGVVLGHGGALGKMLPPFRLGVGGRIGSGRQWMSWIHVEDVIRLIQFALENDAMAGPVNATAPNPVTNARFTQELAGALHRPALFPVPKFALKIMFGEMAGVIIASQRALPAAAQRAGFDFQFAELKPALDQILVRKS